MKKNLSLLITSFIFSLIFAQSYKISDVHYNIQGSKGLNLGKTNPTSLQIKCPIDTKTIFDTEEKLNLYLIEYKQRLSNLRAFDSIEINYEIANNLDSDIIQTQVLVNLKDSNHLLIIPYPKYDSNKGFTIKLKAKDSNFLGTLNPFETGITFEYNHDSKQWFSEFSLNYDFPFIAGPFNATWNNDFNLNYIIGDKNPPTVGSTVGISFELPRNNYIINFGTNVTLGYEKPIESTTQNYFFIKPDFHISTPIIIYKANNYSTVNYNPYANIIFSWDLNNLKNGYPIKEGMEFNFGHSLYTSKIDWTNNFRNGYTISLNNDYKYKFENLPVPTISLDAILYKSFKLNNKNYFNLLGITTRSFIFTEIEIPGHKKGNYNIGSYLRGIRNKKYYKNECSYGVVLNFDLPINIITTSFKYDIINFSLQFSPFIDIAFSNNPQLFNFNLDRKDYTTGFEVIVYPKKFSNYLLRGSIGFDLNEIIKSDKKINALMKYNEIYIGLDLHY